MRTQTPLRVHWVRHGKVSSHQGDVPVTDDGLEQAEEVGRKLAEEISPDEDIFFLYAPTRRTRETAVAIRNGMDAGLLISSSCIGRYWVLVYLWTRVS